jgi:hypothetical protein
MPSQEHKREPDVIEPAEVDAAEVDDETDRPRESVSRPDVPATGRTITNLMRGGRVIS